MGVWVRGAGTVGQTPGGGHYPLCNIVGTDIECIKSGEYGTEREEVVPLMEG